MVYTKLFIKEYQQGSVLFMVLVWCMIIAIMTTSLLESSILQKKMHHAFQSKIITQKETEQKLIQLEKILKKSKNIDNNHIRFIQFVPDTLHLHETQGINYYAVIVSHHNQDGAKVTLRSTVAVRNKVKSKAENKTPIVAENGCIVIAGKKIVLDKDAQVLSPITQAADAIYFGDNIGRIWKIDWHSKVYQLHIQEPIEHPISVGRHRKGEGVLLYVLTTQGVLHALWDNQKHNNTLVSHFILNKKKYTGFKLRQGTLEMMTQTKQIERFDAFSGMKISKDRQEGRLGRRAWEELH